MAYEEITFGGYTLNITDVNPVQKQKTRKVVLGKSLVESSIIGLNAKQWELSLSGMVVGTTAANLATNRTNLEALDNSETYAYTDGLKTGTYIIKPGTLVFQDSGNDVGNVYRYSMSLIEW